MLVGATLSFGENLRSAELRDLQDIECSDDVGAGGATPPAYPVESQAGDDLDCDSTDYGDLDCDDTPSVYAPAPETVAPVDTGAGGGDDYPAPAPPPVESVAPVDTGAGGGGDYPPAAPAPLDNGDGLGADPMPVYPGDTDVAAPTTPDYEAPIGDVLPVTPDHYAC